MIKSWEEIQASIQSISSGRKTKQAIIEKDDHFEIHIGTNAKVLIDKIDYDLIASKRWFLNSYGYAAANFLVDGQRKMMFMHRILLEPPNGQYVDHINHNILDNRRSNLRLCTMKQNLFNQKKRATGTTSIYKGVSFRRKKWNVQLSIGGQNVYISSFNTEIDAAIMYNLIVESIRGDYAYLNDIPDSEVQRFYQTIDVQ